MKGKEQKKAEYEEAESFITRNRPRELTRLHGHIGCFSIVAINF